MYINNQETALLGLLLEQAMYAYQIEKAVEYRDMRFWTDLSMSGIYKTLKKLEAKGLAESTIQVSKQNKTQKIFTITPKGRRFMAERVKTLLTDPVPPKIEFDLAVYNLDVLPQSEALEALAAYQAKLKEHLKGYRDLESFLKGERCQPWRLALATRRQAVLAAEVEWVETFRKVMEAAEWTK